VYRLLVGKPEGRKPLEGPRLQWEDNIKMDLLEIGRGSLYWMSLVQNSEKRRAVVNAVMRNRVL
jgi:hypothetical protein